MRIKKDEIDKTSMHGIMILVIGCIFILFMPYLLTRPALWNSLVFSETGQIGDTIGGITAPISNLIGAILVFLALRAQIKANQLIQEQINRDNQIKDCETETANLNQLYSYLNESINNYRFTTLPPKDLQGNIKDIETECMGGEAFHKLFSQIRCNFHGDDEKLLKNQSVAELFSILKIVDNLLDKLQDSKSNNKEILNTLIRHLFEYRITTRINDANKQDLERYFCKSCQCNHGIPTKILDLIKSIREKLNMD